MRTQVGIVGAGPAGLMLSHLLALAGVDSVVVEKRGRDDIEATIRAGVLEHGTVELMQQAGIADRVMTDGTRHDGIDLRYAGAGHRIDLLRLTGKSVWLYPQHEVLKDLINARLQAGGDVRFDVADVALAELTSEQPVITFTDPDPDGTGHAIGLGVTAEEIGEVLLHCAVYAGVPAANRAFAVAQNVLTELSAEPGADTTAR